MNRLTAAAAALLACAIAAPVLAAPALPHGVADPAKATDLKLTIVCIGGAVAYVNGQEAGRGHLPAGALQPLAPAERYPIAAYTTEDGATALPALGLTTAPEDKWLDRYEQRARTATINVPARLLVKGRNTLASDLRAAALVHQWFLK